MLIGNSEDFVLDGQLLVVDLRVHVHGEMAGRAPLLVQRRQWVSTHSGDGRPLKSRRRLDARRADCRHGFRAMHFLTRAGHTVDVHVDDVKSSQWRRWGRA